jgi:hypothetical protein
MSKRQKNPKKTNPPPHCAARFGFFPPFGFLWRLGFGVWDFSKTSP